MVIELPDVRLDIQIPVVCFLQPAFWREFKYSKDDVKTTIQHFSSRELWQSLLMQGILANQNAISISYSNPESILINNKACAIKKLMSFAPEGELSNLNTKSLHTPPLPFYRSPREHEIIMVQIWTSRTLQPNAIHFNQTFDINGEQYVPLEKVDHGFNVVQIHTQGDEHPLHRSIFVDGVQYYRGNRFFTITFQNDTTRSLTVK